MRPTAIKPMIPALALPLIGLAVPALAQDAEAPAATVEAVVETLAPLVDKRDIAAFLELHIEQGPQLEKEGVDLGIVSSIVGTDLLRVTVKGRPDHAGTALNRP